MLYSKYVKSHQLLHLQPSIYIYMCNTTGVTRIFTIRIFPSSQIN